MRKCMNELVYLLKAKIQCIWIDTYEEAQVFKDLIEIVNGGALPGMKLYSWSFTEGLRRISLVDKEKDEAPDKKITLDKIFGVIGDAQDNTGVKDTSIYVLKDLHLYNDTHQVKRALRDVKERSYKNYNPIIVVSPIVNIPIEHEKLFTVIHYDTPDKEEISGYVNKMAKNISGAIKAGKQGYVEPTDDTKRKIVDACVGLTYNEIADILAKSTVKYKQLSLNAIMEAKIQLVEKSGVLDYRVPEAKFEDIGGNDSFKEWLDVVEDAMSDEAVAFGCKRPKGYLALGIPGTSKSFAAEAIANRFGQPLLELNMSKIMNKLVGESEKKIEQAFRIAKACAPCIMLFDEVEKALSGTRSSNSSDAGTTSRVFSTVLKFLNDDNGVFTIMTSNDVSQLPPELTRAGRLDAMWYFSLPTEEERKSIFKIHLDKTGKEYGEDLINVAAKNSENYTGAEIKEIVKSSVRRAYRRFKSDGVNSILEEDILPAIKDTIPVYDSSREKILYLEQWVNGRARYTNGKFDEEGYNTIDDDKLAEGLRIDLE
jgi:SpoVK/Ycf46/Vps4 family AAA+-type ATPase